MRLQKPKATESETQKAILQYLNMAGHYVWRNNSGAWQVEKRFIRFGKKGSSDILGVSRTGKIIAIEVKKEGGVVSGDQEDFLFEITKRGGIGCVAYSVDDVIEKGL